MKKYFRFGFAALALALVFNVFAATETKAQGALNEILKRMDEHYKVLSSLQAGIVRERTNVQLNETDRQEGTIVLLPGKGTKFSVRLDWRKPKEEKLSVVNGQYVAYIPGQKQAYTGNSSSRTANEKGGNILRVMSMSKEELKANYNVEYLGKETVSGNIPTWRLKLTPKKASSFKFAELWVDGNGMPIQGKVVALNNDTDTILLQNMRKNETISGKIFKIDLPKGTNVIKG
ncbi:MAG: outer-membrane lipoprotein carrier protein LolA [Acidobacteriota bacterium]|nr:outer-membrane lipoprotein carrier protein LolA [Acidobacteriota bacterium]